MVPKERRLPRRAQVSSSSRAHRTLVRFLHSKLQNEPEAREIAQEAYVRLLELGARGRVDFCARISSGSPPTSPSIAFAAATSAAHPAMPTSKDLVDDAAGREARLAAG